MEMSHYETKEQFGYVGMQDRTAAVLVGQEDNVRRAEQFRSIIANKNWIDVGTGAGAILELLSPVAAKTIAVEPQKNARDMLREGGYNVYASIEDVPDADCEVATLFHVFEHLIEPIGTLESLRSKMSPGATLIIEVPHADDVLLTFFNLEAFKEFTFWSEHLILHTRESLRRFLEKAGFEQICIMGFQRYPLANHLHWLAEGKPGGHIAWDFLRTDSLDESYGHMLARVDKTDTLIAVGRNGSV
jgi:hypothetical protein